jgi:L-histidine Nalpha-methyltransferase
MPTTFEPALVVDVHLGPDEAMAVLRADARHGLSERPKELSPTWFYDEAGCRLFDLITELDEYYPTRAERSILDQQAHRIAVLSRADTFIELGSGTSDKSRLLLDALSAAGTLERYVPFDVAEPTLRSAAEQLALDYPDLKLHGVVGDFRRHLGLLPRGGRRLLAILGGTIGNFDPAARAELLATLSAGMVPGDTLLIGTDLVKDRTRLVQAYDDEAGVTAAFNLNVLTRLNRELGANFDVDRFEHVAVFDEDNEWIEMRLRSLGHQVVDVPDLDLMVDFLDGETMRTEISAKFRPERFARELTEAGLDQSAMWTDPAGDFALSLSVKPEVER